MPLICQEHRCIMAFVFTVSSAWNVLSPHITMSHTLKAFRSIFTYHFFDENHSLTINLKWLSSLHSIASSWWIALLLLTSLKTTMYVGWHLFDICPCYKTRFKRARVWSDLFTEKPQNLEQNLVYIYWMNV